MFCRGEGVHAVTTHLPEVTEEAVEGGSRWVSDTWERKTERNLEEQIGRASCRERV